MCLICHLICYDQLNLGGNACLEKLVRRIQAILDAWDVSTGAYPEWGTADLFMGDEGMGDAVDPELREHVSRRVKVRNDAASLRNRAKGITAADGGGDDGADVKPAAKRGGNRGGNRGGRRGGGRARGVGLAPLPQ